MTEGLSSTSIAAVPDDTHQSLLKEQYELEKKVGHVTSVDVDDLGQNKKSNDFVGLTKEELQAYINSTKWKRIRSIIAFLYISVLLALLVGSILLIVFSRKCPPKPKLDWYEKNIIYEVDLRNFQDSNGDGIGDLKGLENRLDYFEKNHIKSILLTSTIFNQTSGTSTDFLTVDPTIANENQINDLLKVFNRKDMNLIIDVPLATTFDPNGLTWYGSNENLKRRIIDPCANNQDTLGCIYYRSYGKLPLPLNNKFILNQSISRISSWLSTKKFDGIRVNLPLSYNSTTGLYVVSYNTIQNWIRTVEDIAKKSKPKLLLFDIPLALEGFIKQEKLHKRTAYSLLNQQQTYPVNAVHLFERFNHFQNENLSKPSFWRMNSQQQLSNTNQLNKEMLLTLTMLLGGTPVVLYGDEINLNQRATPLMSWRPDQRYNGFSNCSSGDCLQVLSRYQDNLAKTSVQREEAQGGAKKDSVLKLFRYLAKLRQKESFQYGLWDYGYDPNTNIFWFIREASGHHGYVVVLNLNSPDEGHISLQDLTAGNVPYHIHCEYQWPTVYLPISNTTHVNSDNLVIHPQSINIFSWPTKPITPKVLKNQLEERHQHHHHHHQH